MNKPTLWMMTGVPCSGKSTILSQKNGLFINDDDSVPVYVADTDSYIEDYAERNGIDYNAAFQKKFKAAEFHMKEIIKVGLKTLSTVVWDQTNITKNTRRRKLAWFSQELKPYQIVGVGFAYAKTDLAILQERNLARAKATGKYVPSGQIETMFNQYELPTEFDHMILYDIQGNILNRL